MIKRRRNRNRKMKAFVSVLMVVLCGLALAYGLLYARKQYLLTNYPLKYTVLVETYSEKYDLDKYFVYAVIKTESGFNSDAQSNADARGLMQITSDTFDWLKFRHGETDNESITFDDMYEPETNIRYGCYFLGYLRDEFGGINEMAAGYHAGVNRVSTWLSDKNNSADGKTLDNIPISDTAHYVDKINSAYKIYKDLYTKK